MKSMSPSSLTAVTPSSRSSAMSSSERPSTDLAGSSDSAGQRGDSSGWSNTAESYGTISFFSSASSPLRRTGPKADCRTAIAERAEARVEEIDADFAHNHLTERPFDMAALTPEMDTSLAFLASVDTPTLEILHYPHLCTILTGLSKIIFGENPISLPPCSSLVSPTDFLHLQTTLMMTRSTWYTPAFRFRLMAALRHTSSLSTVTPDRRRISRFTKSWTNRTC